MGQLTANDYPALSRMNNRSNSTFLPMKPRKFSNVATHSASKEYTHVRHRKWHLGATEDYLRGSIATALGELDEEKLRRDSALALRDKAKERLLHEGVSKSQQRLILNELNGVLKETRTSRI